MKLNRINPFTGDPEKDKLIKLANRIKALRLKAGHPHWEKFALGNNISRMQYRRYELGGDMRFSSLLRVLKALDISLKDFFSEGFD